MRILLVFFTMRCSVRSRMVVLDSGVWKCSSVVSMWLMTCISLRITYVRICRC